MNRFYAIAKALTYVELCYLDDALKAFAPCYPVDETMVKELMKNVSAARGWVHHVGKTDRKI